MAYTCVRTPAAIFILMGAIEGEPPNLTYEHGIYHVIEWLTDVEKKPPYPTIHKQSKGVPATFSKQASVIEDLYFTAYEHTVLFNTLHQRKYSEGVRETIRFLFDSSGQVPHPLY